MNREQRRAAEARQKMQRNTERVKEIVQAANATADFADRMRTLLFALVREQGRVRVRKSQIDKLHENDRVDFRAQENGDVIIEFTKGDA